MVLNNKKNKVAGYLSDIYELCSVNEGILDLAIEDLNFIIKINEKYVAHPNYYISTYEQSKLLEDIDEKISECNENMDEKRVLVTNKLNQIFNRKLRKSDLNALLVALSPHLNQPVPRSIKRSKSELLSWFCKNWSSISTRIPYAAGQIRST